MVRVASLLSQLLHHFPRTELSALVKEHGAEVMTKGFPCWTQFVAMPFCRLARADSLRGDLPGSFLMSGQAVPPWGKHGLKKVHTVLRQPAQAVVLVPSLPYSSFFILKAMERFRTQSSLGRKKSKFKFKNKLLSLDSSTITLCLSLFP